MEGALSCVLELAGGAGVHWLAHGRVPQSALAVVTEETVGVVAWRRWGEARVSRSH